MDDLKLLLKKNIFQRATYFLEKFQLFVPFGAKIINGHIRDVVIDDNNSNDTILGAELIETLKMNFSTDIENNLIDGGAIAYDVSADFPNLNGVYEERDALCLLITFDGKFWEEEFFPYKIIDNKCVWG